MQIDVFTLFPHWFDWFRTQRHVANALANGHALETVDPRATTPLKAGTDAWITGSCLTERLNSWETLAK